MGLAIKMTLEEFIQKVNIKHKGKIKVLSTIYINNKTPIEVQCNDCKEKRFVTPNKLLTDSCCPTCSGKKKITTEQYKKDIKNLVGDEYSLLEEYVNVNTPILMKHNKCGFEWKISRSNFIFQSNRCPQCSHPSKKKNDIQFKKEFEQLSENNFRLLSNYGEHNQIPIKIQCIKCDFIFEKTPNNIIRNGYILCPNCDIKSTRSISVGSKKIKEFLDKNNIIYKMEKKFKDFRNFKGDYYFYDFYIPDLKMLIEFDGNYHFLISERVNKEGLMIRRENDIKKDNFALEKNLNLLRISQKEIKKIDEILDSVLFKKTSTTIRKYNLLLFYKGKKFNKEKYYTSRSTL